MNSKSVKAVIGFIILIASSTFSSLCWPDTVYRYKDANGRWQFSDKKPKTKHEQLALKKARAGREMPRMYRLEYKDGFKRLVANNPWFSPVTFYLLQKGEIVTSVVVEPKFTGPVFDLEDEPTLDFKVFDYQYLPGKVITQLPSMSFPPPIPRKGKYQVTQSFHGKFSHFMDGNRYSVDIAMDLDDHIHAVREGTVVWVKDDYHMGGAKAYFVDKANQIRILHDDGTFAVYAHILMGSALVKEGDKVAVGQAIANAGTSGYSTGPHLHFVLRYNSGNEMLSIPFSFKHAGGEHAPKPGEWLTFR